MVEFAKLICYWVKMEFLLMTAQPRSIVEMAQSSRTISLILVKISRSDTEALCAILL